MLTRNNVKQASFFLRLLSCSLVGGVALAGVIAGSFDVERVISNLIDANHLNNEKVQLNFLNPEYLEIPFALSKVESLQTDKLKTRLIYKKKVGNARLRKLNGIKKISLSVKPKSKLVLADSLVQVRRLQQKHVVTPVSKKKKSDSAAKRTKSKYNYNLAKGTTLTNDLSVSEFIELQELMNDDAFAYEKSGQYIAELNRKKTDRVRVLAAAPQRAKAKVQIARTLPTKIINRAPAPPVSYLRKKPKQSVAKIAKRKLVKDELAKKQSSKKKSGIQEYTFNKTERDSLSIVIAAVAQKQKMNDSEIGEVNQPSETLSIHNRLSLKEAFNNRTKPLDRVIAERMSKPKLMPKRKHLRPVNPTDRIIQAERDKPIEQPNLESKLVQILNDTQASEQVAQDEESQDERPVEYSESEIEQAIAKVAEEEKKSKSAATESGLHVIRRQAVTTQPPAVTSQVPTPTTQTAALNSPTAANPDEKGGNEPGNTSSNEIVAASATPIPRHPMELKGILTGDWKKAKGHFEVGFYAAINVNGEPVGAPQRVAILPPGKRTFKLKLNGDQVGYLFAKLYPSTAKDSSPTWHAFGERISVARYAKQKLLSVPIALRENAERSITSLAKAVNAKRANGQRLKGRVQAMFSNPSNPNWIAGARVRLRGTNIETTTNSRGKFELTVSAVGGRALVEVLAPGYLPRVLEANFGTNNETQRIEIASKSAIKHLARSLGLSQSDQLSVIVLDTKTVGGVNLPGISAELSLKADGPFYFNENGFPDRSLGSTTGTGKLIFFNVEPGIGFMETYVLGQAVSPVVISVLDGNEVLHQKVRLSNKEVFVKGKLFDPIESKSGIPLPISGARIRVAGSVDWTETDSFGSFELPMLRFAEGSEILLEVSARGYYKHRFSLRVKENKIQSLNKLKLFVFPKSYISELANSVDLEVNPNKGLLIGKISLDEKVRIDTLSEHSSSNLAKDYYFDENNILRGSYAFTQPRNGLFSVFNVSPGRALLHGYNPDGTLRYSGISYFSPSTINVIVE